MEAIAAGLLLSIPMMTRLIGKYCKIFCPRGNIVYKQLGKDLDDYVELLSKEEVNVSEERCGILRLRRKIQTLVDGFEKDVNNLGLMKAKRKNLKNLKSILLEIEVYQKSISSL